MMRRRLMITAALAALCLTMGAAPPQGWYLAGDKPASYETGVDKGMIYNGLPSAYLKSKQQDPINGFGTLMQDFSAEQYAGKRVRFTALVKTEGITDWAGLWMRVDESPKSSGQSNVLAFDNMQDRPLKGTLAWQKADVVLDVPDAAKGIYLGVLLSGPGAVWLNNCKVEVVGADVPTTDKNQHQAKSASPTNLGFEK